MDDGTHASGEDELREFLLRACHDLRTPLRAVRANTELLRVPEKRQGPDVDKILGFILDGAKRMDSLVDGLANYTLALHTEARAFLPTRLGTVLRSAIARLAPEIRECGADVISGELPRVFGDPDRLAQLFENLLRNALQSRGSAPLRIYVTATARNGAWLVSVRDNGKGIEADDIERIFRPFERLRRDGTVGAGLGLTACREIVLRHGGKIWAQRDGESGQIESGQIESGQIKSDQDESGATLLFTLPAGER